VELTRKIYLVDPEQYHKDLAQRLQQYGSGLLKCGLFERARDVDTEAVELTRAVSLSSCPIS